MVDKFSSTVSVNRPLKRIHTGQQEGYQREEFYEDICDPKIKGVKQSLAYAKFNDN